MLVTREIQAKTGFKQWLLGRPRRSQNAMRKDGARALWIVLALTAGAL